MSSFVYNRYSSESRESQWKKYLQQKEFATQANDTIKTAIEKQTSAYQESIKAFSQENADAIRNSAEIVSGTFESGLRQMSETINFGFDRIADGLSEIGSGINELGVMLDWRMNMMIEEQRISNLLSENIALLLRVPEIQKERQYHIEQGFKHFKNASQDPDLYSDALENLLEAEKREKTDYITLHRIGMIYLYSPNHIDAKRAEDYFRRAAKYAVVESDPKAARIANILSGNVKSKLSEQEASVENIKIIAAESYHQAGIACYVQGKLAESSELSEKAATLVSTMLEARFTQAKALIANGKVEESVKVSRDIVQTNRFYAIKVATDGDLGANRGVQNMLATLRQEAQERTEELIEIVNTKKSKIESEFDRIESLSLIPKPDDKIKNNIILVVRDLGDKEIDINRVIRFATERDIEDAQILKYISYEIKTIKDSGASGASIAKLHGGEIIEYNIRYKNGLQEVRWTSLSAERFYLAKSYYKAANEKFEQVKEKYSKDKSYLSLMSINDSLKDILIDISFSFINLKKASYLELEVQRLSNEKLLEDAKSAVNSSVGSKYNSLKYKTKSDAESEIYKLKNESSELSEKAKPDITNEISTGLSIGFFGGAFLSLGGCFFSDFAVRNPISNWFSYFFTGLFSFTTIGFFIGLLIGIIRKLSNNKEAQEKNENDSPVRNKNG